MQKQKYDSGQKNFSNYFMKKKQYSVISVLRPL